MKILIKGAGDLASGVAYRLKKAGHQILMTECAEPTTVRRTVAFSRAVYEGYAEVEHIKAVCINTDGKLDGSESGKIETILEKNCIAVAVDEQVKLLEVFKPEVVIDAIIAKRNISTHITDAEFVIGIGPGFNAGLDCHAVIETKRGHTLGRVIYHGSAEPNTGIPGNIGGYSIERIIRTNADGVFHTCKNIGDMAEMGETVAFVIDKDDVRHDINASISGIIRGLLQDGIRVHMDMKAGDIDPRARREYCFEISDKSLAIAGGVLEAVTTYEAEKKQKTAVTAILLAAGNSERFGSNKLLEKIEGKSIAERVIQRLSEIDFENRIIVTQYEELKELALKYNFTVVTNEFPEKGISYSIKLAMKRVIKDFPQCRAVLFSVCDQPYIKKTSIERLISEFRKSEKGIASMAFNEELGNPNVFDSKYFAELLCLEGDKGGKRVVKQHISDVIMVQAEEKQELHDIDVPEDNYVFN